MPASEGGRERRGAPLPSPARPTDGPTQRATHKKKKRLPARAAAAARARDTLDGQTPGRVGTPHRRCTILDGVTGKVIVSQTWVRLFDHLPSCPFAKQFLPISHQDIHKWKVINISQDDTNYYLYLEKLSKTYSINHSTRIWYP